MKLWIPIFIIALAACSHSSSISPLTYIYVDKPDEKRILVKFKNDGSKNICISSDMWPTIYGNIDSEKGSIFIKIDGHKYGSYMHNGGYCPDGCPIRVKPGGEIYGYFLYDNFNIPIEMQRNNKTVEFSPYGYICKP